MRTWILPQPLDCYGTYIPEGGGGGTPLLSSCQKIDFKARVRRAGQREDLNGPWASHRRGRRWQDRRGPQRWD